MQVAAEGVGRVLEAVGAASGIIRALQQHYATVIEPKVDDAPVEATACATGLAALVRAVERQVLNALQAALTAFFAQVRLFASGPYRLHLRSDMSIWSGSYKHVKFMDSLIQRTENGINLLKCDLCVPCSRYQLGLTT